MRDPVLASVTIPGAGRTPARFLRALGGLHYLRGNSAPYFSLTMEGGRYNTRAAREDIDSCGCNHEEILRRWPRFADLAALHLSDINGEPMHAEANGVYHLAGADPSLFRQEYHAGNCGGLPSRETEETCRRRAREHFRITEDELSALFVRISAAVTPIIALHSRRLLPVEEIRNASRAVVAAFVEEMRPRWKAEAEACIQKHGLKVYGDSWTPAEPVTLAEVTR